MCTYTRVTEIPCIAASLRHRGKKPHRIPERDEIRKCRCRCFHAVFSRLRESSTRRLIIRRDRAARLNYGKNVLQPVSAGDRNVSIKSITRTHARENPNKAAQVVGAPALRFKSHSVCRE